MGITERLAKFLVDSSLDQMPREVVLRAKELILNQVGVALGGSVQPTGQLVIDYVNHMGGSPQATVLGSNFKTSSANAALANGTSAAALDADDSSFITISHPVRYTSAVLPG